MAGARCGRTQRRTRRTIPSHGIVAWRAGQFTWDGSRRSGTFALDVLIVGGRRIRRLPARTLDPPYVIRRNVGALVASGKRVRHVARGLSRFGIHGERSDVCLPGANALTRWRFRSRRPPGYVNSRITASTARLSPFLAWIFFTTPSRSARSTFSIFIASTTASVSPALTSWPSATAIETTSPGIGQRRDLPLSAVRLAGIRRAAAASRSV